MSNHYPNWWDTTITIYNRYEDPQTQYVLKDCFWKYSGNKITIDKVVLDTNSIICRIRVNENFLEKYEWINVPNDEMHKYFTLGQGDIIVKGEVEDEIDEYHSGKRSSDLKKKSLYL